MKVPFTKNSSVGKILQLSRKHFPHCGVSYEETYDGSNPVLVITTDTDPEDFGVKAALLAAVIKDETGHIVTVVGNYQNPISPIWFIIAIPAFTILLSWMLGPGVLSSWLSVFGSK